MARSMAVLGAVLLAALPTAAWAVAAPAPLLRAALAPSQVAYAGEQMVVTWDGRDVFASLVRVEHDPAGWTRLDYRPVGSASRWTVLRRGEEEIRFDPVRRTGTRMTSLSNNGEGFESNHLPWLLENYRITTAAADELGRQATRVEFVPVSADRPARHILVDDATGVVMRSVRVGPNGQVGEVTAFLAFEQKPVGWRSQAAPPTDLRLQRRASPRPAAGTTASVLGGPPVPVIVPAGFHEIGEYVSTGDDPVLQRVYSDGLTTLVVSQRRGAIASPPQGSRVTYTAGGPVWVHTFGLRTLAYWSHAGRVITVVGDVSPQSLLAAAERTGVASTPRLWDRLLAWFADLFDWL